MLQAACCAHAVSIALFHMCFRFQLSWVRTCVASVIVLEYVIMTFLIKLNTQMARFITHALCRKKVPVGDSRLQCRREGIENILNSDLEPSYWATPNCASAEKVPVGDTLACSTAEKASTWCLFCCDAEDEMLEEAGPALLGPVTFHAQRSACGPEKTVARPSFSIIENLQVVPKHLRKCCQSLNFQ